MEASVGQGRFRTNVLVGVLSLVTLVILAVVTGFLLEKENPLTPRFHILARFDNAGGLKVGDPVTLAGANVGHVSGIVTSPPSERWPEPGYFVELQIEDREDKRQWIREDSTFRIVNDNLFGNRRVEISFGTEGAKLAKGTEVDGEVASGLDQLGQAVEDVQAVTGELRTFILGNGEGEPAIADSLEDLRRTLENTAAISNELRAALSGDEAADMKRALRDLEVASGNLRETTESVKSAVDSLGETIDKIQFWKGWFSDSDKETDSKEEAESKEEAPVEE